MALINHTFPALEDQDKIVMLQRLLETQKPNAGIKEDTALKALHLLDNEDDSKMFASLRDRLEDSEREKMVIERFGGSGKDAKKYATPECLKQLRPDVSQGDNTSGYGAVLTWQMSTNSFQGYYPTDLEEHEAIGRRKRFTSTSRKYQGDDLEDKMKALWQVVSFLWREHVRQGGSDDDKPSREDVMEAMATAEKEFEEGKCVLKNVEDMDIFQLANLKSEAMPADVAKRSQRLRKARLQKSLED